MRIGRMFLKLALGVTFLFVVTAAAEAQTPSGSIALESPESSGEAGTWTGCTLLFKGKLYACSLTGLTAPITGVSRVSGVVYDLKEVGTLAGTYKPAGDSLALGGGHLTVKNQSGVMMVLSAFGDMVELKAADKGIQVELKGEKKR
jgi:hypothetical protein